MSAILVCVAINFVSYAGEACRGTFRMCCSAGLLYCQMLNLKGTGTVVRGLCGNCLCNVHCS
jgi:hypothetical protein